LIEPVHQPSEIEEGPAQAVNFIYHDAIHSARIDILQQVLKSGPLQAAAGEPAIIVVMGEQPPAGMLLALDEGLRRLALRLERVEVLLETLLGRFASVHSTSN